MMPYTLEEIVQALERCYHTGPRDVPEAGVHPTTLAKELPEISTKGAHSVCKHLADRGIAEQVYGIGHDTKRPRKSYVPAGVSGGDSE